MGKVSYKMSREMYNTIKYPMVWNWKLQKMVKKGKPEPDIYLLAAEKLGLQPDECIALEDSPNGLMAAYRAGCLPIMVPDLSQPDEKLSRILYGKAETLTDVIPYLAASR